MIDLDTPIDAPIIVEKLNRRIIKTCHIAGVRTWRDLLTIDKQDLALIPHCGLKTITEIEAVQRQYKDDLCPITPINVEPIVEIDPVEVELSKYKQLHPRQKYRFESWTAWKYTTLSVRAKNVFPRYDCIEDLIAVIYSNKRAQLSALRNCGKKTTQELEAFFLDVQSQYEKSIDWSDVLLDEAESAIAEQAVKIERDFPFLLSKECELIIHHVRKTQILPILYIWEKFILRTDDKKLKMRKDYLGLSPNNERKSITDIADELEISRERARQLLSVNIELPEVFQAYEPQLRSLMGVVVSEASSVWKSIQAKNMLNDCPKRTMRLVCAFLGNYKLVQFDEDTTEYMVRKDALINVKLKATRNELCRIISLQSSRERRVRISDFIQFEDENGLKEKVGLLYGLFEDYLPQKFVGIVIKNHTIIIPPNKRGVGEAVENILRQRGQTMSLDELLEAYNKVYAYDRIDSRERLRNIILKNPHICPKGKSGTYVLSEWDDQYTGCLTNYLMHIIETFKEPVALDDLVEFALEEFPKTNKKSVYSLVSGDKFHRFKVLKDDYIALSTFELNEEDEKKFVRRYSVDVRFKAFMDFVTTYHRFPNSIGTDEEQMSARWLINYQRGNIEATDEQRMKISKFLRQYKDVPQNALEYKFKQTCDQVKVIVAKTFSLPNRTEHLSEYNWLMKYRTKYHSLMDNRKQYFEDLLNYLVDYGFYL